MTEAHTPMILGIHVENVKRIADSLAHDHVSLLRSLKAIEELCESYAVKYDRVSLRKTAPHFELLIQYATALHKSLNGTRLPAEIFEPEPKPEPPPAKRGHLSLVFDRRT